jgi:hypothetical protein
MDDPNIWVSLTNQGYDQYEINQIGQVRNKKTKHHNKEDLEQWYPRYSLVRSDGAHHSIDTHRLLLPAFIPQTNPNTTVDHIDRNQLNNKLSNLRWATPAEQMANRNIAKDQENGKRSVWRLDPNTLEELELYDSLKLAATWVFNKGLSGVKILNRNGESCIRTGIINIAKTYDEETETFPNDSLAYKFKWKYNNVLERCCDNERWLPVSDIIKKSHEFKISSCGRIINNSGKYNKISVGRDGYYYTTIRGNNAQVHRVVAATFVPGFSEDYVVNHKDGNKLNPHFDNLEWISKSGNAIHAINTGLRPDIYKIIQYSMVGERIAEFNHSAEAGKLLKLDRKIIRKCCFNIIFSHGGYRFQFKHQKHRDEAINGEFYAKNLDEIHYDNDNAEFTEEAVGINVDTDKIQYDNDNAEFTEKVVGINNNINYDNDEITEVDDQSEKTLTEPVKIINNIFNTTDYGITAFLNSNINYLNKK